MKQWFLFHERFSQFYHWLPSQNSSQLFSLEVGLLTFGWSELPGFGDITHCSDVGFILNEKASQWSTILKQINWSAPKLYGFFHGLCPIPPLNVVKIGSVPTNEVGVRLLLTLVFPTTLFTTDLDICFYNSVKCLENWFWTFSGVFL